MNQFNPGNNSLESDNRLDNISKSEQLAHALFRISNAVNTTENLDELFLSIYDTLNNLKPLPNFFICLVEEDKKVMNFPFYIDEFDEDSVIRTVNYDENSSFITIDVIKSRKPLFLDERQLEKRHTSNRAAGTMSKVWLGVPLVIRGQVIGVMAVQHYRDPGYFSKKDMDLFVAVSEQIALAIDRKQSQEIILAHQQTLEKKVAERTKELNAALDKLTESETHFRETIELLPEMVFETDDRFMITYANKKAHEMFLYTRRDIEKGIAAVDIIAPKDRKRASENMIRSISGERVELREYEVVRKDGTAFPAIIESLPVMKGGKCVGMRGVIIDMTAQKKIQKDKERMAAAQKELEIARNLQASLLPSLENFNGHGLEMAASMAPAESVGGDYYDVIVSPDKKLWFGIGDVTGHGLMSGLVMMMAQVAVNTLIRSVPGLTPAEVLIYANRILQVNIRDRLKDDHYMTISLIKEEKPGVYSYAGAHETILVYRAAARIVEQIPAKGMWLGIIPDISKPTFEHSGRFYLEKDDVVCLYTDGVIEARNHKKEQFDIQRLERFFKTHAHHTPDHIKECLSKELLTYMDRQKDDMTFLILKKL